MSRREKKKFIYIATVIVYIYTVTIVDVYIYKLIHPLMWVVFCRKCVNLTTFCILHTGVIAVWSLLK